MKDYFGQFPPTDPFVELDDSDIVKQADAILERIRVTCDDESAKHYAQGAQQFLGILTRRFDERKHIQKAEEAGIHAVANALSGILSEHEG